MLTTTRAITLSMMLAGSALAQEPIAYWSFDSAPSPNVVRDESGHEFDLIATHGKTALKLIDGVRGKALGYSNVGFEIVAAESRGAFTFGQGSIEAIVYYVPSHEVQGIFSNGVARPGVAEGYGMSIDAGGRVTFASGNDAFPAIDPWNVLPSTVPLTPRTAYHIAVTYNDAGTNKVYINGAVVASGPFLPIRASTDKARVAHGYQNFGYYGWSRSPIDELKVYDQALSEGAIQSHYLEAKAAIDSVTAANP